MSHTLLTCESQNIGIFDEEFLGAQGFGIANGLGLTESVQCDIEIRGVTSSDGEVGLVPFLASEMDFTFNSLEISLLNIGAEPDVVIKTPLTFYSESPELAPFNVRNDVREININFTPIEGVGTTEIASKTYSNRTCYFFVLPHHFPPLLSSYICNGSPSSPSPPLCFNSFQFN